MHVASVSMAGSRCCGKLNAPFGSKLSRIQAELNSSAAGAWHTATTPQDLMGCGGSKPAASQQPASTPVRRPSPSNYDPASGGSFKEGQSFSRRVQVSNEELMSTLDLPPVDDERYTSPEPVWEALAAGDVKPLRLSWLLKNCASTWNSKKLLPRSQEMPAEAFVGVDELKAIFGEGNDDGNGHVLPLIAVSSNRLTRGHVDPEGTQLAALVRALESEQKRYLLRGFTELGVVWPWASIPQRASGGIALGSGEEEFWRAMRDTMDLWFAHDGIATILLSKLPAGVPTGYSAGADEQNTSRSGWPAFERFASEQEQKWQHWNARWDMVLDLSTPVASPVAEEEPPTSDESDGEASTAYFGLMSPARNWPVGPDDFDVLAEELEFEDAKERALATELFRKSSISRLGTLKFLAGFEGLPPPSLHEAARFGKCCNYMNQLSFLNLEVRCSRSAGPCAEAAGPIRSL